MSHLLKDRVLGCMVGGAVGDALGYPMEFWNYDTILNEYGRNGITRYKLGRNGKELISDDTQMTLFTAAGLLIDLELWPKHVKRMQDIVMQAIDLAHTDIPDETAIAQIGEGWTGHEALAIAMYCAIKHANSFEDAVVSAVNHSGDSDSTGAICGNIIGCLLGRSRIPEYYTDQLELIDVIEEIAADLYTGCIISEYDPCDTPEKQSWERKYVDMRWKK